jgi:small subunit ribosomal protein S6
VLPPSEHSSLPIQRLEGLGAGIKDVWIEQGKAFMPLYEHVYLARQDLSAQQVEELTAQLTNVIGERGGKVAKTEYWGVKSLAYRIRKNRKAHMTLLNIDAPPDAINEVERQERLNEDVLRYLTIRVEEHEEGPSAMMRKADRDRDDRGERGGRSRGERRSRDDSGDDSTSSSGAEE